MLPNTARMWVILRKISIMVPPLLTHSLTRLLTHLRTYAGKGKITYYNGHEYIGSFVHSKKHGLGVYKTNEKSLVLAEHSVNLAYNTNLIEEQVLTHSLTHLLTYLLTHLLTYLLI